MIDPTVRNPFLMATLIALGGLLSACGGKYPSCRQDQDCKSEFMETCIDGSCQNCTTDEDCIGLGGDVEAALVCQEFRCQSADALVGGEPSGAAAGEPCTERTDCADALACRLGVCEMCIEDLDCAPMTCDTATGKCAMAGMCETDDQCAMDEICDAGMCVFSGEMGPDDGGPCGLRAVFFAFDSDDLTSETEQELTALAECMKSTAQTVYLEAHADNRGTEEYNILLTERRGTRVRRFLLDQGVDGELLRVIAKGSLEATGVDEQSRAIDRRVQIIWQ